MAILLIIGGSSTALEIRECADMYYNDQFDTIYNVIGDNEETSLTNVIHDSQLDSLIRDKEIAYIIGFTNQKLRNLFSEKLSSAANVSIIHPTSFISPSAKIGKGSYIGAMAVISSNANVGKGCMINISVSIGHDSIIGDNCIINPGARISGHCVVGNWTLIGANSFVFQGKKIGEDCAIDAMTYIDRDIEENKLCTGNVGILKVFKNRIM
jgi:sugar O-acyltransferase (sialic acid O-acetyltransferase NeuD family)